METKPKAERGGHDSRAVANRFVRLAQEQGEPITILQLVKFVYLAHGWHLGFHDKPLVCHGVQALKHGPVVPEVYNTFRPQGIFMTKQVMREGYSPPKPFDDDFPPEAEILIGDVYKSYTDLSPYALSALTHMPGTPWHQVISKGFYAPIPNEIIRDYYLKKVLAGNKQ